MYFVSMVCGGESFIVICFKRLVNFFKKEEEQMDEVALLRNFAHLNRCRIQE